MKLLIVEDDPDILEFIKLGFKSDGYAVDTADDGLRGSFLARTNPYNAIILDYSLPTRNGLEVCQEIREAGSAVPILFLSVMGDTEKRLTP